MRPSTTSRYPPRPFLALATAVLVVLGVMHLLALFEPVFVRLTSEPRAVTARGELAADEASTINIFERVSTSVAYITTSTPVVYPGTRQLLGMRNGAGSGFIWDDHGHVVTNYHVVAGATGAEVRLSDQRTYTAILIGASPEHDLAVLRIDVLAGRPPPVPIGTSHDLKVGQKVFAIGNPFGLDRSLTTGVISAVGRSIRTGEREYVRDAIQIDAAINPGNSGGPLIDSAGRLIGVNTLIYSPSGAFAGVGFAVPVDTVNRVVPKLIAAGRTQTES